MNPNPTPTPTPTPTPLPLTPTPTPTPNSNPKQTVTISGFGSILLLEPLRNTHAAGTSVEFLPTSPPASPVAAVEEEVKGPGPAEGGDSAVSGDKGDEEAFMITMIVTLVLLCLLLTLTPNP